MEQIYIIDLRVVRGAGYVPDHRVPFDKFYIVSPEAMRHVTRITPYSLSLPLHSGYKDVIGSELDFDALVKAKYEVVLPIHMTTVKKDPTDTTNELYPSYSVRTDWWGHPGLERFLPDTATLHTPTETMSPPCAYCTRSLEHLSGECKLGTADCAKGFRVKYTPVDPDKYKNLTSPEPFVAPPPLVPPAPKPAPRRRAWFRKY